MNSSVGRQAAILTMGLWTLALGLIMLPLFFLGRPPSPAMAINVVSTLMMGLGASAIIYRLIGALARETATKRACAALLAAMVLAAIIALVDAAKDSMLMAYFEPAAPSRPVLLGASANMILFAPLMGFTAALHMILHSNAELRARDRQLAEASAGSFSDRSTAPSRVAFNAARFSC